MTYTIDIFEPFGAFIRRHRKQRGLTQDQLAVLVGVSQPTISEWEQGKAIPDGPEKLEALAEALKAELDLLMDVMTSGPVSDGDAVVQAIWAQQLLTRDERNALILVYKRFLVGRERGQRR